jgi:hypothetical protein
MIPRATKWFAGLRVQVEVGIGVFDVTQLAPGGPHLSGAQGRGDLCRLPRSWDRCSPFFATLMGPPV